MKSSIIVPVYNDPEGIRETIESIGDQVGPDTQLLIVDNGSTDETRKVIDAYAQKSQYIKCIVQRDVQSAYAARNAGIRQAVAEKDTEVIALLDADMRITEGYFKTGISYLREHNLDYMGCRVNLTVERNKTLAAMYNFHTGFPVQQYLERHHYAPTCSLFVRRKVFEEVGLFDPRLISGGDMEFGNRVNNSGYTLGYCPNAITIHPVRNSIQKLFKKNIRVGRGHCQLQRYYPERYGKPPIPPHHASLDTDINDLGFANRLSFNVLGTAMAAARASGYIREFLSPTDTGAKVDKPPQL